MNSIYKITNLINNKCYIGKSSNSDRRFNEHIEAALFNNCNYHFHRAIRKYGVENFKKEIITEGDYNKELLNELENIT